GIRVDRGIRELLLELLVLGQQRLDRLEHRSALVGRVTVAVPRAARQRLLDLHEELDVRARLLELGEHDLELLLQFETGEGTTQAPGDLDLLGREQLLFATGARGVDVDGREDALVGKRARETQLHVAGALDLLEDHLVHLGSGLHERRREDRQRAAALDVARGAEEALRRVERGCVHATREDASGCRRGEVVRAAETGDRIEQHDDVVAELDEALGALDGELGDRRVVFGGTIEGRGDDLALDRALHVGDLFGPLVHEHHHDVDLGVVLGDRLRDGLEDERLAGLGGRDDEAALTLADGGDEVDDPRRELLGSRLETQALVRVDRRQLAEVDAARGLVDALAVDRVDLDDRVVLLTPSTRVALARLTDGADDRVALAQVVLLDLAERDVDVGGAGQVTRGAHERVVVEQVEDAGVRDEHVVVGDLRLELVEVAAATVAVAVAVTATTALALLLVALLAALLLLTALLLTGG